jgi:hypothetical protein
VVVHSRVLGFIERRCHHVVGTPIGKTEFEEAVNTMIGGLTGEDEVYNELVGRDR